MSREQSENGQSIHWPFSQPGFAREDIMLYISFKIVMAEKKFLEIFNIPE